MKVTLPANIVQLYNCLSPPLFSAVIPVMLIIYGFGCIPQAYIFSLGPQAALNTMAFVIVNVVFGIDSFFCVFRTCSDFLSLISLYR